MNGVAPQPGLHNSITSTSTNMISTLTVSRPSTTWSRSAPTMTRGRRQSAQPPKYNMPTPIKKRGRLMKELKALLRNSGSSAIAPKTSGMPKPIARTKTPMPTKPQLREAGGAIKSPSMIRRSRFASFIRLPHKPPLAFRPALVVFGKEYGHVNAKRRREFPHRAGLRILVSVHELRDGLAHYFASEPRSLLRRHMVLRRHDPRLHRNTRTRPAHDRLELVAQ